MLSPKCSCRCVHTGSTQSQSTRGRGRALRTLPCGSWTWLVWSGSPSPEGFPCAPGSEPQCRLTGERRPPERKETNDELRLSDRFNKLKVNVYVVKEPDDWLADRSNHCQPSPNHLSICSISPANSPLLYHVIHLPINLPIHPSIHSTHHFFHPPTHSFIFWLYSPPHWSRAVPEQTTSGRLCHTVLWNTLHWSHLLQFCSGPKGWQSGPLGDPRQWHGRGELSSQ